MLFDDYIMVDWNSGGKPCTGCNSVWIAHQRCESSGVISACNPSTRGEAMEVVSDKLRRSVDDSRRVMLGFDFPFGFPSGTAAAMGLAAPAWKGLWEKARADIRDCQRTNENNRFQVAEKWRADYGLPFYGKHQSWDDKHPHLPRKDKKPAGCRLPSKRKTEQATRASSVWQLFGGPNVVGGQALTGMPHLWRLRFDSRLGDNIVVWPFETNFTGQFSKDIVLVEIYPSSPRIAAEMAKQEGRCKDEKQAKAACVYFSRLDRADKLGALFSQSVPESEKNAALEEGWIFGVSGV